MQVVWFFLSGVCHQIPARSFHFDGQPLPLCARCTGTFLGLAMGLLLLWALREGRAGRLPSLRVGAVLAVPVVLWGIDGANSFLMLVAGWGPLYAPSNTLRLLTGLGLGLAVSVVLYAVYHYSLWRGSEGLQVLSRPWRGWLLVPAGAVVAVAILAWPAAPYALWAGPVVLATAASLVMVNAALVALVSGRAGTVERGWQALPFLAGGLVLALGETGALALVRRWLGA